MSLVSGLLVYCSSKLVEDRVILLRVSCLTGVVLATGSAAWSGNMQGLSGEMKHLASALPEVMSQSRAPSTVRKYMSAFEQWKFWAKRQDISHGPADPFHVALYLVKIMQGADSAAPVTAESCAISWFHSVNGWPDPCSNPLVQNVRQAATRSLARPRARKAPLSKRLLSCLYTELATSTSLQDLQTITLIVLGYSGMLWWDDLSHIYVDEIVFKCGYMAIFLEVRKNDQLRHGHWYLLVAGVERCAQYCL